MPSDLRVLGVAAALHVAAVAALVVIPAREKSFGHVAVVAEAPAEIEVAPMRRPSRSGQPTPRRGRPER